MLFGNYFVKLMTSTALRHCCRCTVYCEMLLMTTTNDAACTRIRSRLCFLCEKAKASWRCEQKQTMEITKQKMDDVFKFIRWILFVVCACVSRQGKCVRQRNLTVNSRQWRLHVENELKETNKPGMKEWKEKWEEFEHFMFFFSGSTTLHPDTP